MSDQISDAVFTTEQVLDDDEPVRVPETASCDPSDRAPRSAAAFIFLGVRWV